MNRAFWICDGQPGYFYGLPIRGRVYHCLRTIDPDRSDHVLWNAADTQEARVVRWALRAELETA